MRVQPGADRAGGERIGRVRQRPGLLQDHGERLGGGEHAGGVRRRRDRRAGGGGGGVRGDAAAVAVLR